MSGNYDAFVVKLNPTADALVYSTYLGGSDIDFATEITVDAAGQVYLTGNTGSSNFPTAGSPFDPSYNGGIVTPLIKGDAFVAKLNAAGSALVYSSFLGGATSYDVGTTIAVDNNGNAYVGGSTRSNDFPTTPGVMDSSFGGDHDGFLVKVNPTGSALTWATYLGDSYGDYVSSLAVDTVGQVYATGYTDSPNFPVTPGSFDETCGTDSVCNEGNPYRANDAFVVKLNAAGSGLVYGTFLGDAEGDVSHSIAVDETGYVYIIGATTSSNFPTTASAYDASQNGNSDVFVTKLNPAGSDLAYSTFVGGLAADYGYGLAVDEAGHVYLTGDTRSSGFPTTLGSFDSGDAFVSKLALGPLSLQVLAPDDTPVTNLSLNNDGWPTPNPLTIEMFLHNTTDTSLAQPALQLTLNSPYNLDSYESRFHMLNTGGFDDGVYNISGVQYKIITDSISLGTGQNMVLTAQVWVQPSITTTLSISAELYTDFAAIGQEPPLGADAAQITIPQAKIHPLVVIPGFLGTWPPRHGGQLDPLTQIYDNALTALQQTGYETGEGGTGSTLIAFGYDWREPLSGTGKVTLRDEVATIQNTAMEDREPYVDYSRVDLLAHSAGGLVARAYIENRYASNEQNVNKLITLATPHQGTPGAYRGWYGGDTNPLNVDSQALSVMIGALAYCGEPDSFWPSLPSPFDNPIIFNYLQDNMPSVSQLLPPANVSAYLLRLDPPYDEYPFKGQPPNLFLDDLNDDLTNVIGQRDYDVTKLRQVPQIISSFSPMIPTDGQYRVITTTSPPLWEYGEVLIDDRGQVVPTATVKMSGDVLVT